MKNLYNFNLFQMVMVSIKNEIVLFFQFLQFIELFKDFRLLLKKVIITVALIEMYTNIVLTSFNQIFKLD